MTEQPTPTSAPATRRRRADADRSVAAILDAALDALAGDPEASMAEIARRAGVVRATIYVHFPTREALIAAVTKQAIAQVTAGIAAVDPASGEPEEALRRVLARTWRELDRFHALVAINARLPKEEFHALHLPVIELLAPLIVRGQQAGVFRADVPVAWHLSMVLAICHAASGELLAGRIPVDDVQATMVDTVVAALSPR